VDFTFGEKPPYVGFAGGRGDPAPEDRDGVGIETINVSKLQIEVWRVADRKTWVRKSISAPDPTKRGRLRRRLRRRQPQRRGPGGLEGRSGRARRGPGQKTTTVFPWAPCWEMKAAAM